METKFVRLAAISWILTSVRAYDSVCVEGQMAAVDTEFTSAQEIEPVNGTSTAFTIEVTVDLKKADTSNCDAEVEASGSVGEWNVMTEMYEVGACVIGAGTGTCQVANYPNAAPHVAAVQSVSTNTNYATVGPPGPDVAMLVMGTTSCAAGLCTTQFGPEIAGDYQVRSYVLNAGGLKATYWDNIWFVGTDVGCLAEMNCAKDPNAGYHNWGSAKLTEYGLDYVSVRWEGYLRPTYTETHTIYAQSDDGVRVWIDRQLVIDAWDETTLDTYEQYHTVDLDKTKYHHIMIEYRELLGDAEVKVQWSSDSIGKSQIPADNLYVATELDASSTNVITVAHGKIHSQYSTVSDNEADSCTAQDGSVGADVTACALLDQAGCAAGTGSTNGCIWSTSFQSKMAGVDSRFQVTAYDVFKNEVTSAASWGESVASWVLTKDGAAWGGDDGNPGAWASTTGSSATSGYCKDDDANGPANDAACYAYTASGTCEPGWFFGGAGGCQWVPAPRLEHVTGNTHVVTLNIEVSGSYKFHFESSDGDGDSTNNMIGAEYSLDVVTNVTDVTKTLFTELDASTPAGQMQTFKVQTMDQYDNTRDVNNSEFTVRYFTADNADPSAGHGTCTNDTTVGFYICTLTLTATKTFLWEVEMDANSTGTKTDITDYLNRQSTRSLAVDNNLGMGIAFETSVAHTTTDAGNSSHNFDGATQTAAVQDTFDIMLQDRFNNIITNDNAAEVNSVTVSFTHSDGTTVVDIGSGGVTVATTGTPGTLQVSYTLTLTGAYTCEIKHGGVAVTGSGFAVTVEPTTIDASKTLILADANSGTQAAQAGVAATFSFRTYDTQNNERAQCEITANHPTVTMSCDTVGSAAGDLPAAACVCNADDPGRYDCTYTLEYSGAASIGSTCQLIVKVGTSGAQVQIYDSPWDIISAPGAPEPLNFEMTQLPGEGVAGVLKEFVIQAKDQYDNHLLTGGLAIAAKLYDANDVYISTGTTTDNGDGTYTFGFTEDTQLTSATFKLSYTDVGGLRANYYSDQIFQTPYAVDKIQVPDFDWGYGAPYTDMPEADYFSAKWEGWFLAPYTETFMFSSPMEPNSRLRLTIDDEVVIETTANSGKNNVFGNKQLTAGTWYSIKLEFWEDYGQAKVSLQWQSQSIPSPATVPAASFKYEKEFMTKAYILHSAATSAATIEVAPIQSTVQAGVEQMAEITTYDGFGNKREAFGTQHLPTNEQGLFACTITPEGYASVDCSVVDAGNSGQDARYTVVYTATLVGKYQLSITYNGAPVKDSPFAFTSTASAPDASQSTAVINTDDTLSDPTQVEVGVVYIFTVHVRDQFDNYCNCDESTVTVVPTFSSSNGIDTGTIVYNQEDSVDGSGIWTIHWKVEKTGTYVPTIALQTAAGAVTTLASVSPSSIVARATHPSVTTSYITVLPIAPAPANVQQTVQVQVLDTYGNTDDIPDDGTTQVSYRFYATLTDPGTSVVTSAQITGGMNGLYDVQYTADHDGQYVLAIGMAPGTSKTRQSGDGLTGNYYNNRWTDKAPVMNRVDSKIQFDWESGLITATAKDYVSVVWTGFLALPASSWCLSGAYPCTHTFTATTSTGDGAALKVDGVYVFDEFMTTTGGAYTGSYEFANKELLVPIELSYRHNTGAATMKLEWETDNTAKIVIASTYLHSSTTPIQSTGANGITLTFT